MNSTRAFNINIIRSAADEFAARFTGFGTVKVVPTHIDNSGAFGIAQSSNVHAVEMVEAIAIRRVDEQAVTFSRQEYLRMALAAGEISEEQFISEMGFA